MSHSELKVIRDFADKKIVKASNGKYYNYGYTLSVCMHPSTRDSYRNLDNQG